MGYWVWQVNTVLTSLQLNSNEIAGYWHERDQTVYQTVEALRSISNAIKVRNIRVIASVRPIGDCERS